jgi:metal-responsive CopG/Arc/MetJ family transcriptional regulator
VLGPKIKLSKELFEKVKQLAELSGYSSVDEFVAHVLEKEITKATEDDDKEKVKERLKGLGYIS